MSNRERLTIVDDARQQVRKLLDREIVRFVISGGINTVVTYLVYAVFVLVTSPQIAFTICYIVGIVLSYYLNSLFVFRAGVSLGRALRFPVVYIVQYVAGLLLLQLFIDVMGIDKFIAPMLVVIATLPLTFILSKVIIKGRDGEQPNAEGKS